jgi:PPP family 3-phenylpropionic acid transporter
MPSSAMFFIRHSLLLRFVLLYATLFSAFGLVSPFLPVVLTGRGLDPEELGIVLGLGTAVRLVCGPVAGRLADRFNAFRAVLAACAVLAGSAAPFYLSAHGLWAVMAVAVFQAAVLAPIAPLADALSLANARAEKTARGFEYGWVRGVGSAAFIAGTLLAGHAAEIYGVPVVIWLSAAALSAIPMVVSIVPAFPQQSVCVRSRREEHFGQPWSALFRQKAFVCVTLVAALVLGSHAMYDTFAVIRWRDAGIGAATVGVLWSLSVGGEVLVFLFIGPPLLRLLGRTGALALAASCALVRWGVMAQTTDIAALALVQPLHGFTFALLHLASMRIITDSVPSVLSGTAQTVYGLIGVGGATAVLTIFSGWLYGRLGLSAFWVMGLLCIAALPVIWKLRRVLPGCS